MEDDWIANFFDRCRLISDEQMQTLWGRILAGEANSPGTFSKRTIELVSALDKADATLFSQLCSFSVTLGEIYPLIYDLKHEIYRNYGMTFSSLSHLESIGLIHFSTLSGYLRDGLRQKGHVPYFGSQIWIELPQPENNTFQLGQVLLTKAGQQLASICIAQPREGFVDYVKEKWKTFGYKVDPPADALGDEGVSKTKGV